jgi:hypothetical protein
MQINRQIISNFQQRSRYFQGFGMLDSNITMSKFSLILAVCMITFTSLLFTKTLEIQHSCKPMIHYGTLPTECQLAATNNFKDFDDFRYPIQQELKTLKQPSQIAQNTSKPELNNIARNSKVSNSEISSSNIKSQSKTQSNSISMAQIVKNNVVKIGVGAGLITGAFVVIAGAPVYIAGLAVVGVGTVVWQGLKTIFE